LGEKDKMSQCYITIFTPTYNRIELLTRLYHSLKKQERVNFEWLIIDDASSDDTQEHVSKWIAQGDAGFPIRYFRQEHGGKHRALNKAFELAEGNWFFIVDSDDYLTESATKLVEIWAGEVEGREDIAAVSGLRLVGGEIGGGTPVFKNGMWVEAGNLERMKYNLGGDKAEIYRTEIIKNYPFPEFQGEYFVTEAVCWDAIAADGYKIRWYNEVIYICNYLEDGLTKSGVNELSGGINNYRGFCFYTSQCLRVKNAWGWSNDFRKFCMVARAMHKDWGERAGDLKIPFLRYVLYSVAVIPCVYFVKGLALVFKKITGRH